MKVLEAVPLNLKQSDRTVLKINSALYGSGMLNSFRSHVYNAGPEPMDIANIEKKENSVDGAQGIS